MKTELANISWLVYRGVCLCPFVLVVLLLGICVEVVVEGISSLEGVLPSPPRLLCLTQGVTFI